MLRSLSLAALVLLLPSSPVLAAGAAVPRGLPAPVVPEGFGVNIHFVRTDEAEMDKLAALGVRFIRMDFAWGGIERKAGVYDFSGYDALVENMAKRDIRCLFILDYANRLYDEGRPPHTDAGRKAFATWAAAAAKRYAGKGVLWEIWNEPNLGQFWKPTPNAEDYCKLAHATIDAIRAADPQAFILGPASSGFPWDFFEVMAREGVFAKLDAVSVHPYRQKEPETAEADYHKLRLLLHRAVPGRVVPIVSGEWGYSTAWKGMDEKLQAKYVVRQWLTNLANDVHLSIWYDWRDDGLDPKEPEHHFGLVYRDFKDKPAAVAARALCKTLEGYRFLRRIVTEREDDHVLVFGKGKKVVLAAWTTGTPHDIALTLGTTYDLITMAGERSTVEWDGRALASRIRLSDAPLYLAPAGSPGTALYGVLRPARNSVVVKAGEAADLPVTLDDAPPLWVHLSLSRDVRDVLGLIDTLVPSFEDRFLVFRGTRSASVPFRLKAADREVVVATLAYSEAPVPMQRETSARIVLLVANHVTASVLPAGEREARVAVQNPSGEAQAFELEAIAGEAKGAARVAFAKGQTEALAVVPMSAAVAGPVKVTARGAGGLTMLDLPPVTWRAVRDAGEWQGGGWKARLDGDAKVEAKVALDDGALPSAPVQGLSRGLRLDYRFADGWRFASLVVPPAARAIHGRPTALGLWVHADGSKDLLRVRLKDKTGQMHQATAPSPLTWSGWRWVEIPFADAHHWGGANDGKLHEPLELDSIVIDNARQAPAAKERRAYLAGMALKH